MRYVLAYIVFLISMPVIGSELICEPKGFQSVSWDGKDVKISETEEENLQEYKIRFISGKDPKIAYIVNNKQRKWHKLSTVKSKKGSIYYSALTQNGLLSAVLGESESKLLINYIRGEVELIGNYLNLVTELVECKKL